MSCKKCGSKMDLLFLGYSCARCEHEGASPSEPLSKRGYLALFTSDGVEVNGAGYKRAPVSYLLSQDGTRVEIKDLQKVGFYSCGPWGLVTTLVLLDGAGESRDGEWQLTVPHFVSRGGFILDRLTLNPGQEVGV